MWAQSSVLLPVLSMAMTAIASSEELSHTFDTSPRVISYSPIASSISGKELSHTFDTSPRVIPYSLIDCDAGCSPFSTCGVESHYELDEARSTIGVVVSEKLDDFAPVISIPRLEQPSFAFDADSFGLITRGISSSPKRTSIPFADITPQSALLSMSLFALIHIMTLLSSTSTHSTIHTRCVDKILFFGILLSLLIPINASPSPTSIDDLFSLDLYAWKLTNSLHLYTTSSSEIQALQSPADGTDIGIIGQLAHTRQDGKGLPLYRLYSASVPDYFYTTNVVERDDAVAGGYTFKQGIYEGGIGYCFANKNDVDGVTLVPLTRYHDSGSNRDHCYATPDSGVCDDSKYGDPEGIQCYIRRAPTDNPTKYPTKGPTLQPSYHPTPRTSNPTRSPTLNPTPSPTSNPTSRPTSNPTSPTPSPTSIDDLFSLDLYAWKSSKSFHLYTTSSSEIQILQSQPDGTGIGIIGQLAHARQHDKGLPLYRLHNPLATDHFYTTNVEERDDAVAGGYTFEKGIYEDGIGYCFANENDVDGVTLVPLTRYSATNEDHCYATQGSGLCGDSKYGDAEGIQCYIRRASTDNPSNYPTKGPTLQPSYHPTPSPTSNPTSPPTSNPTSPTPSPTSIDDLFSLDLYAWKSTKSFHFYTTSSSEIQALQSDADGTNIGIIGQLAHTRQDGKGLPLYRLYSPLATDHFYTTNVEERKNAVDGGYIFEKGIYEGGIGYCFANKKDVDVTLVALTRYSGSNGDHCYETPDSGLCNNHAIYGDPDGIQCYVRQFVVPSAKVVENKLLQLISHDDRFEAHTAHVQQQWVISLQSPWVMAIGGLLAVNIVFLCYSNCIQPRIQPNRLRYSPVKGTDSEFYDTSSECDAINVVYQNKL